MPTPVSPDHTPERYVVARLILTSSVALSSAFFVLALSLEREGDCQTEVDDAVAAAAETARQSASDCSAPDEIPLRIKTATRAAILKELADADAPCRIVPVFKNGKAIGFKIFGVREGSLFRELGFESGDVVTRIGTYDITSPASALEAYEKLLDAEAITVTIERRGVEFTRAYVLKDDACGDGRTDRDFVRAPVAGD